jgi:glycosyltransferase involved in cell wall biosynthesis
MPQEKSERLNLLVISDAIAANTGLARITRDLVTRVHAKLGDIYRVGAAGCGSPGSCKFGFPTYNLEGMRDWIIPSLPEIVEDFAGNDPVTLLFVWDLHRIAWLAEPRLSEASLLKELPQLRQWAIKRPFRFWCYTPIDASGPNDRLTFPLMRSARGVDRLVCYGPFGEGVLRRTIGDEEADKRHLINIPHGISGDVFYERGRTLCRRMFLQITGGQQINEDHGPIADDECLIGICATNLSRKDWPLAIETCALIAKDRRIRVWIHTNKYEGDYSIPALLVDYGILDKAVISLGILPDDKMAEAYSACDLTIAPGLGEGMGYPIFERLFCGTPCVHGNYGGAPHWMTNPDLLVEPVAYRYEGSYACKRPVFRPEDFVEKIVPLIGKRTNGNSGLEWNNLWPQWERWFRGALND